MLQCFPADKFVLFCNAMPVLRDLVEEGNALIRMSGEQTEHSMETIVRSWINTVSLLKRCFLPTVFQVLHTDVGITISISGYGSRAEPVADHKQSSAAGDASAPHDSAEQERCARFRCHCDRAVGCAWPLDEIPHLSNRVFGILWKIVVVFDFSH